MAVLPGSFPKGTEFFEVEGVPVSSIEGIASAWDCGTHRWFMFDTRVATRLSEANFRAMVAAREPHGPNESRMEPETVVATANPGIEESTSRMERETLVAAAIPGIEESASRMQPETTVTAAISSIEESK